MNELAHRTRRMALAGAPRSWTGRSALSRATDSELPQLVTVGTRKTRVSELRDLAPGAFRALELDRRCDRGAITRAIVHRSPPG